VATTEKGRLFVILKAITSGEEGTKT